MFRERSMRRHSEKLARFKAGYQAQRQKLAGARDKPWTSETILEVASVYQIPPLENRYPLAPKDGRCPHCRAEIAGRESAPVCGMYADRTVYECRKCTRRFVRITT